MGLVLSRNVDESFTVTGPAVITVTKTRGIQVSLHIEAEPQVRILKGKVDRFNPDPENSQQEQIRKRGQ